MSLTLVTSGENSERAVLMGRLRDLTESEYARCFAALKAASKEHRVAANWFERKIAPRMAESGSIRVLSVGSGSGEFDRLLINALTKSGSCELSYWLLEPNARHRAELLESIGSHGHPGLEYKTIGEPFEAFETEAKFDLIVFAHSLYYFQNRRECIRKALGHLSDDGIILIIHQSPVGINQIQRKFMRRLKGSEREMFSSADLTDLLRDMDVSSHLTVLPSALDVSSCLDAESQQGRLLLSFFLEADLADLAPDERREVLQFLSDISFRSNGRLLLFHPVAACLITQNPRGLSSFALEPCWGAVHEFQTLEVTA